MSMPILLQAPCHAVFPRLWDHLSAHGQAGCTKSDRCPLGGGALLQSVAMEPSSTILVLEDDPDVATAAAMLLRRRFGKAVTLDDPARLDAALEQHRPDLVLLDLNFTPGSTDGREGLALLARLRSSVVPPAVIAMTAYADVPLAVEALKQGACDFVTKPWDNARLAAAVEGALARRQAQTGDGGAVAALMGESRAMRELKSLVACVGPTQANVMILGENGVGKELVARAVHLASARAAQVFLAVDMGALPESTVDSELFGHRRGAFTDAREARAGRFQAARGGTLFLDEIGNLPLGAQAKLLTALERREVTPVGADRAEAIDVRVLSATNLDEARLFDPAVFRTDLLFRLNTIVIRVPPLRERREDIGPLLRHYLSHYERQYGKPARELSPAALGLLEQHAWPGNVRALRHACERAVILCNRSAYDFEHFGMAALAQQPTPIAQPATRTAAADDLSLDAVERDAVAAALAQAEGNISQAARLLGVSRPALYRKMEKHGL
jgi:DNA-binding NtrC family response regulator